MGSSTCVRKLSVNEDRDENNHKPRRIACDELTECFAPGGKIARRCSAEERWRRGRKFAYQRAEAQQEAMETGRRREDERRLSIVVLGRLRQRGAGLARLGRQGRTPEG